MATAFFILLAIALTPLAILVALLLCAPHGYQDENGFRFKNTNHKGNKL